VKNSQSGLGRLEMVFVLLFVSAFSSANMYVGEEDALKDLGNGCPGIKKIVKLERNFFAKSLITAETYDGVRVVYEVDTNVFLYSHYSLKTQ